MPPGAQRNQGSKAPGGKNIIIENTQFKNGNTATTKQWLTYLCEDEIKKSKQQLAYEKEAAPSGPVPPTAI